MDKDNLFDNEITGSLAALAVTLGRLIASDPEILLHLNRPAADEDGEIDWTSLYHELKNEGNLERLANNLQSDISNFNWDVIEEPYRKWGQYGWITHIKGVPLTFWDNVPDSQEEADQRILFIVTSQHINDLQEMIANETDHPDSFREACNCYKDGYYTACASLLLGLIDSELIKNQFIHGNGNKKTGEVAGKRVVEAVNKNTQYGLPGSFHLQLINFEAVIHTFFQRANGFEHEPNQINRNFLHHGMNKRKVLKEDCLKLFFAYEKALDFADLLSIAAME